MIIRNLDLSENMIKSLLNDYLDLKDEVSTLRGQLQDMKERVNNCQSIIQKQTIREGFYQSEIARTKNNLEKIIQDMHLSPHLDQKNYEEPLS